MNHRGHGSTQPSGEWHRPLSRWGSSSPDDSASPPRVRPSLAASTTNPLITFGAQERHAADAAEAAAATAAAATEATRAAAEERGISVGIRMGDEPTSATAGENHQENHGNARDGGGGGGVLLLYGGVDVAERHDTGRCKSPPPRAQSEEQLNAHLLINRARAIASKHQQLVDDSPPLPPRRLPASPPTEVSPLPPKLLIGVDGVGGVGVNATKHKADGATRNAALLVNHAQEGTLLNLNLDAPPVPEQRGFMRPLNRSRSIDLFEGHNSERQQRRRQGTSIVHQRTASPSSVASSSSSSSLSSSSPKDRRRMALHTTPTSTSTSSSSASSSWSRSPA